MAIIDLVIATKNRHKEFKEAIISLKEQTIFPDCKLWILDGNNDYLTKSTLNDLLESSQFEYFSETYDFPAQNKSRWASMYNWLINKGDGEYITYWSDDIVLNDPNLLDMCIDLPATAIPFYTPGEGEPRLHFLDEYLPKKGIPVINVGLIDRKIWRALAGLDEQFDFYYADIDLSLRIFQSGHTIDFLDPSVYYAKNNRHDKIWRNSMRFNLRADSVKFYQKWGLTPGKYIV